MDPISVAIMRVKAEIPREILNQAFMPKRYDPTRKERYYDNSIAMSIDELIRSVVIEGRVAIDTNLVSGTEMLLPLQLAEIERVDPWNIIYRFGREATGGRRILSCHEVLYGITQGVARGNFSAYDTRSSQLLQVGRDILRGAAGTTPASTSYVQLIGHNTLLVNDVNQMVQYGFARCQMTHEENFNDLKPCYYREFAALVVQATKAYVYNSLIIDLDESMIKSGASIGRFREVVDGYSDANQMYDEGLIKWQKIGYMNDRESMVKIMKLSLGAKPKF